jgi:hypothetical protein
VFWHTDICLAVGDEHAGSEYARVLYIASAPDGSKNRAYLPKQKHAFLQGCSAPDFGQWTSKSISRADLTEKDLTDLGRAQMGL